MLCVMVKGRQINKKGSITVEAALVCPFLCLILFVMLSFTLELYNKVEEYGKQFVTEEEKKLSAPELIRLEAVTEDWF